LKSEIRDNSMTTHYDTILIGAGHNGLVAAAYLARQGKKVLILERRSLVGGSVVTESFGDGFTVDSVQTGGTLRPDIIKDLKLGLPTIMEKPPFISLQPDGNHLALTAESIKRFSEKGMRGVGPTSSASWIKPRIFLILPIPRSCRACQKT
jgi:phytoene dehydrogenase-like protein